MKLTPKEQDRLTIFTLAELAHSAQEEYVFWDNMGFIDVHFDGIEKLTVGTICSMQLGTHITAKMFRHVLTSCRVRFVAPIKHR
jgi:urease gamma subunit